MQLSEANHKAVNGMRRRPRWKNELTTEEFCNRVQVHGLHDIYQSRSRAGKAFWIVSLIIIFALFVFNMHKSIDEFMDNPTSTNLKVETQRKLRIPSMLLCPFNYLNDTKLRQDFNDLYMDKLQYLRSVTAAGTPLYSLARNVSFDTRRSSKNLTVAEYEAFVKNYSYSGCEVIPNASYALNVYDCAQVVRPIITQEGLCYLLNTGATQFNNGFTPGLKVRLNLKPGRNILGVNTLPLDGANVFFGYSIPMEYSNRYIDIGMYASIYLRWSHVVMSEDTNEPSCLSDEDANSHGFSIMKGRYTWEKCKHECIYKTPYRGCGCLSQADSYYTNENLWQEPVCDMNMLEGCAHKLQRSSLWNCVRNCAIRCSYWQQQLDVQMVKLADEKTDSGPTPGRTTILDIKYEDMMITTMEQQSAVTFTTLVSNIGGIVGLWLGASLFTVIQLISLLFNYCLSKLCRMGDNTKVISVQDNKE